MFNKSAFMCVVGASVVIAAGTAAGDEDPSLGIDWDVEHPDDGSTLVPIRLDSGDVVGSLAGSNQRQMVISGTRPVQVQVWAQEVAAPGASWVRVDFGDVDLTSATDTQRGSYLRVTSQLDGAEQYLDAASLREWGNTSAYFNGDRVTIELMASPESTGTDRVQVDGLLAGAMSPNSICGPGDDRELSRDPRIARLMPDGCTSWLMGDQGSTFLTADHCNPRGGQIVQFNVPLSRSDGGYIHPGPEDQYVVQHASIQRSGSGSHLGNDWGVFAVVKNSETGMTPLEAQGDSFTLATETVPNDGRPIRVTGHGVTSFPADPMLNGVQKTHVGSFGGYMGNNILRYGTDTTGGDSGAPVIDESTGLVIGIHTNAGCNSSGGNNHGMSIFNEDLQHAIANPLGLAQPLRIDVDLGVPPALVDPTGGSELSFKVLSHNGLNIDGGPWLVFTTDEGTSRIKMDKYPYSEYKVALPELDCGTEVEYSFEIDSNGTTMVYPENASVAPLRTIALETLAVSFGDDFETHKGWDAGDGWARQVPGSEIVVDGDGSGKCYISSGGTSSTLVSPEFDARNAVGLTLSTLVWNGGDASLSVEISGDGGNTWVFVENLGSTDGWDFVSYTVEDHVDTNESAMIRFTSNGGGTVAIDGFTSSSQICASGGCSGDVNGDFYVDFYDVMYFQEMFLQRDSSVDLNNDGILDYMDVSAFLGSFTIGCP